MQGWFNIQKSINVIHHRKEEKSHDCIIWCMGSTWQNATPIHDDNSRQTRSRKELPQLDKGRLQNLQLTSDLVAKDQTFPPRSGARSGARSGGLCSPRLPNTAPRPWPMQYGGKRKEKAHGLEKKKRNCPVWRRPESAHRESQGIYKQSPRSNACLEGHRILDKDDCISTDKHEHMDTN